MGIKGLTPKQIMFAEAYHITGNAKESAVTSGYSNKGDSAQTQGSNLLRNPKVVDYLETLRKQSGETHKITRNKILDKLGNLMDDENPNVQLKAIEVANKMCGFNEPEKQDITGQLDVQISYEVVGSRDDAKKS